MSIWWEGGSPCDITGSGYMGNLPPPPMNRLTKLKILPSRKLRMGAVITCLIVTNLDLYCVKSHMTWIHIDFLTIFEQFLVTFIVWYPEGKHFFDRVKSLLCLKSCSSAIY